MKRSIFNSLGSNYSAQFVSASLWSIIFSKKSDIQKLENYLLTKYDGDVVLCLYKGRDAIEVSLRVLLKPGSEVITQAFSCYAVEEGIVRAGMKPVYADIAPNSTNMNVATLQAAIQKYPNAQAVLIQHSLGIVAQSVAIKKWCELHGLLLIDDIAQGIGGTDESGKMLGASADAVVFSFGKDKIIDAVSGGAVVFKNLDDEKRERLQDVMATIGKLPLTIVYEDLLYPGITSFIRSTHHWLLGKLVLVLCKKLGLLGSPIISKTQNITLMHPSYARLALLQFHGFEKQIAHRKLLAQEYKKHLANSGLTFVASDAEINRSSNVRFSLRCKNFKEVEKLIAQLKRKRAYVSDRWYRKAVDCGDFLCKTVYKTGSCPNAELLATQVINLPTHREMNIQKVQEICRIITEFLGRSSE